jgi:hypothetical protein
VSAPTTHDPLVVNTRDGVVWVRRAVVEGRGLYAVTDSCKCPEYLMATLAELAEHGIAGSADALPMPVGSGLRSVEAEQPAVYGPAMPWAALLDDEDLLDFLDELTDAATTNASCVERLAEVERACGQWRLIAEAQHAHNTAPGPDAVTQVFAPVAALREVSSREEPHDSPLHQTHRLGHDLELPGEADPGDRLLSGDELRRAVRGHLFGGGPR